MKKNAASQQDFSQGKVWRIITAQAVPLSVAQLIQLLYNIVDRIYICHLPHVGPSALTGVGLFTPILMLITAFAMLCGAGGSPRAAISLGQKDKDQAEKIIGNCFTALMILAVILTLALYVFAPTLLRWFGASDETLPYSLAYGRIYILGTVFVLIVMGMNPFISAQGFPAFSMLTTLIGAVLNIILDPILIYGLGLGVRGAAIATVVSQGVGAVWVLSFLTGKRALIRLRAKNFALVPKVIFPCLALGVSSFVMVGTESILSISFTSSLSRYGGDVAVGAMTIITSVSQLISLPVNGLSQGGQPLVSYNFGAGANDRVRKAFRLLFLVSIGYTCLFWLVVMLFPRAFASVFSSDATLVAYASRSLRIYMAGIFSLGFQLSCQQTFVALSQAKTSLLLACLRKLILLIPLIFILPLFLSDKVFGVFLAEPISDILAAAVTVTVFFTRFSKILEKGPQQKG